MTYYPMPKRRRSTLAMILLSIIAGSCLFISSVIAYGIYDVMILMPERTKKRIIMNGRNYDLQNITELERIWKNNPNATFTGGYSKEYFEDQRRWIFMGHCDQQYLAGEQSCRR